MGTGFINARKPRVVIYKHTMDDITQRLVSKIVGDDCECEITSGSSKGDNFSTLVQRVDVIGNNVELHLVAKKAPRHAGFRRVHLIRDVYLREIYIYETVLPSFELLQKEHRVPTPFRSYPKYYVSYDVEFDECILLGNLKTSGYDNWNRRSGLDLEHALLVCQSLGRLHALSFALRHHKPDVFEEIRRNLRDNEYEDPETFTSYHVLEMITRRAVRSLDPVKDRDALESIACLAKHLRELAKTALDDAFHSKHAVVTHGECWIANLLFRPGEVCLLDWQYARLGSPAFDVAQLLFFCCDHELRTGYYDDLLRAYHASLADFLQPFGVDVHALFSYSTLLDDLKYYSVLMLATCFRVKYLTFLIPEHMPDVSRISSKEELADKFSKAKLYDALYDETMRGIILDYVEFGYKL